MPCRGCFGAAGTGSTTWGIQIADVKDCPRCRLINPPAAARCDCGYDFASGTVRQSYLTAGDHARQADDRKARSDYLAWVLKLFKFWR